MRKKTFQQPLSLLLSALLLLGLLSGCGKTPPKQAQTLSVSPEADAVQPIDPSAPSAPVGEKEETVYVKAAPDGTPREITSEVLLKETGSAALVRDVTSLHGIRNTVGDEEYLLAEDGTLLWENHGEELHYRGDADGELPVSVKITYWLDGEEIAPAQLAGRSGKVKIRFDYENHTQQRVAVGEGEVSVCVPFAALTMVMLPGEHFSHVEVENGRLMDLDGENAVIGLALPGLSDSLSLSAFEPTEELELPEYVELTADVTEFELDFTATVITPGLLDELKIEDLDKLDELREDMEKLQEATDELTDGVGELAEGAGTFGDYLEEYTDGVAQLSDGAEALAEGLGALNQQLSGMTEQMDALRPMLEQLSKADFLAALEKLGQEQITLPDGTQMKLAEVVTAAEETVQDEAALNRSFETLEAKLHLWENYAAAVGRYAAEASAALASIPADLTEKANQTAREQVRSALGETGLTEEQVNRVAASIDLSQLTDPVADVGKKLEALTLPEMPDALPDEAAIRSLAANLEADISLLQNAAEALGAQAGELPGLDEVKKALAGLSGAAFTPAALADGAKQLTDGVNQITDGAKALSEGANALKTAGNALNEGYSGLNEGFAALQEGIEKYNEEGISELTELTGESYQTLLGQLRALKVTDGGYHSFSGLGDAAKGSVRFIVETERIG